MKKLIVVCLSFIMFLQIGIEKVSAKEINKISMIHEKFLTEEQMNEIYDNFIDLGITEKNSLKLIKKLNNGKLIDSVDSDFNGSVKQEVITLPFEVITKITYPDGSVKRSSVPRIPKPNDQYIMPFSITGGDYTNGGTWWTWYGAKCEENTGLVRASTKIDASGSAYSLAKITRTYGENITVNGGYYTEVKNSLISDFEARVDFIVSYFNAVGKTHRLKVTTSGNYTINVNLS